MTATRLVSEMLDGEDNPDSLFQHYANLIGQERAAKEADVLRQFKRQAAGYIKWVDAPDEGCAGYDQEDLRKLRTARSFAEAEAILAKYENPEASFLYMISQGYF